MMALGLVLVSAVAVAFPKTLFSHYFLFLPVPVTLFGAVWLGIAVEMGRQRFSGRQQTIVLVLLVSTVLALTVARPLETSPASATPGLLGGSLDPRDRQ